MKTVTQRDERRVANTAHVDAESTATASIDNMSTETVQPDTVPVDTMS